MQVPETKLQLQEMLKNKSAIPFHAHICSTCHSVPMQAEWIQAPTPEGIHQVTNYLGDSLNFSSFKK